MASSGVNWNLSMTLEQLGGDKALVREILDIFLVEAPKHLATLRCAVAHGRAKAIETAAHTLKGELGYLGVLDISRRAAELEEIGHSQNLAGVAGLLAQFDADITDLLRSIRSSVGE